MRRAADPRLIALAAAVALALVAGAGPTVLLTALAGALVLRRRAEATRA